MPLLGARSRDRPQSYTPFQAGVILMSRGADPVHRRRVATAFQHIAADLVQHNHLTAPFATAESAAAAADALSFAHVLDTATPGSDGVLQLVEMAGLRAATSDVAHMGFTYPHSAQRTARARSATSKIAALAAGPRCMGRLSRRRVAGELAPLLSSGMMLRRFIETRAPTEWYMAVAREYGVDMLSDAVAQREHALGERYTFGTDACAGFVRTFRATPAHLCEAAVAGMTFSLPPPRLNKADIDPQLHVPPSVLPYDLGDTKPKDATTKVHTMAMLDGGTAKIEVKKRKPPVRKIDPKHASNTKKIGTFFSSPDPVVTDK
jgi:hypothetical protein